MSFFKNASKRGWRYTGAILFNRIVPEKLFRFRRYVVYRMKIQEPRIESDIEIQWATSDEQRASAAKTSFIDQALFSNPLRAAIATIDNQCVGAFWVAAEHFDESELGVRVMLGPKQVWLFAAMVNKEKRGLGIYSQILQFVTSELGSEGIVDLLVAVNPVNKPSNHIHKKHSSETVGMVSAVRFLNWAACFPGKPITAKSNFTMNAKRNPVQIRI
jgi:hypothetical protein